MPRVQFSHPIADINVNASMPAPKNIADIQAWLRAGRKALPQVPAKITDHYHPTGWWVYEKIMNCNVIILHLIKGDNTDKAAVIFDRKHCTIANGR